MNSDEIKAEAFKYAVLNAAQHGGEARSGPVLSKFLAEFPELRANAKELMSIVEEVVEEVNSWPLERQRSTLRIRWPELTRPRRVEEKLELQPLENLENYKMVRTRFAPNPDGPLHLGSARPIILCDEYAKMYNGRFVLRFEDTSPEIKAPMPDMYELIKEDLTWLEAEPDEIYIQSDRLETYYAYAEKMLSIGAAYVCTCVPSAFRNFSLKREPCPCRDSIPEVSLDRWKKMLDGTYAKGDAVVRIKTDINHPNPAVRDWPALRISTVSHPRTGSRYRVWPLYNFSCAIDDHEMEISHIIRGKEHEVNTTRQMYMYGHLRWEYPEVISVGRLGLEAGILSKSRIRSGVEEGTYSGWDDPRLGTLIALRRRGIKPKTIRELMIQVGTKPVNATLSWGIIASVNRRIVEPVAKRFFFIAEPVTLIVSNLNREYAARLPLHPDFPDRGTRDYNVKPEDGCATLLISKKDAEDMAQGDIVRLMGLINVEVVDVKRIIVRARLHSEGYQEARKLNSPFIHWLPKGLGVKGKVVMTDASIKEGITESKCSELKIDELIQFERLGFVRIDNPSPFVAYFAHH